MVGAQPWGLEYKFYAVLIPNQGANLSLKSFECAIEMFWCSIMNIINVKDTQSLEIWFCSLPKYFTEIEDELKTKTASLNNRL